jgi:hypothetical protein
VSQAPEGPDRWQAPDGKWHRPEPHSDNPLPPPPPPELLPPDHGNQRGPPGSKRAAKRIIRFVIVVSVGAAGIAFIGNAVDSHQSSTSTTPPHSTTTTPPTVALAPITTTTATVATVATFPLADGADEVNPAHVGPGVDWSGCKQTSVDLIAMKLSYANLSGTNL